MARLLILLLVVIGSHGCATRALWLNGHPPILEDYGSARVRIYRAGLECRVEIIMEAMTIVTLPTRCLDIPHIEKKELQQ